MLVGFIGLFGLHLNALAKSYELDNVPITLLTTRNKMTLKNVVVSRQKRKKKGRLVGMPQSHLNWQSTGKLFTIFLQISNVSSVKDNLTVK